MSTLMPRDKREEQDTMITDCMNREDKLSQWEQNFIQSIREQFDAGRFLSDKQDDTLEKTWNKVTA